MRTRLGFAGAIAIAACGSPTVGGFSGGQVEQAFPVSPDLDLLFVIDDAGTQDVQSALLANFASFVTALDASPTGRPNLHIGVVSSTVKIGSQDVASYGTVCVDAAGDNGLLHNTASGVPAGCTAPNGRFVSDISQPDGSRETNYTGTLQDTFSCIADLGSGGCGFVSSLEGMKRALDGSNPENAGFLRADAILGIVFLAPDDDGSIGDPSFLDPAQGIGSFVDVPLAAYTCDQPISSTTPGTYTDCAPTVGGKVQDIAYYTSFLTSLKDPSLLRVAVIGGGTQDGGPPSSTITTGPLTVGGSNVVLQPSCSATINGNLADADPAIRLYNFMSGFGAHDRWQTVCTGDYSPALTAIASSLTSALSACLDDRVDPTDADPNNPGAQLQCDAELTNIDTTGPLPACAMQDAATPASDTPTPCYYFVADSAACPTAPSNLRVVVDGALDGTASLSLTCATPES